MNKKAASFKDESGASFFSLTDIAAEKSNSPKDVIQAWVSSKDTLEFLIAWESMNNDDFNSEFASDLMDRAGFNAFSISPSRWIESTCAKGLQQEGRRGDVYARAEIALEFAGWISVEFRLSLIKEILKSGSPNELVLSA